MLRKWVILLGGILTLTYILAACAGPQGEQGPVGPAGPAGPEGPAGPAGEAAPTSVAETVRVEYLGDQLCAGCHAELAQTYMKSGHPWSLSAITEGKAPDYPFTQIKLLPGGYSLKDISYIIGGYFWKAIFVNSQGFILTGAPGSTDDSTYLNQFNFGNSGLGLTPSWSSYHAGQADLSFTCGACHATGYDNGGNQGDLPGIIGTWAQAGVRCERCHGPGSLHASNPKQNRMLVERDPSLCQECHTYKDVHPAELKVANGFIQHGDQYGDLSQSKHQILNCLLCHDPHSGVVQLRLDGEQTTRLLCQDCHYLEAQFQTNASHLALNISCTDCHMPRLIQSGSANLRAYTGDMRTHVVVIDPRLSSQFNEDGSLASGQIGLDYACRHCHSKTKTDEELLSAAVNYHAAPEIQPIP